MITVVNHHSVQRDRHHSAVAVVVAAAAVSGSMADSFFPFLNEGSTSI